MDRYTPHRLVRWTALALAGVVGAVLGSYFFVGTLDDVLMMSLINFIALLNVLAYVAHLHLRV